MKTQQQWFSLYAESHRHPTNKRIHNIAVPAIYWSVIALLWSVPLFATPILTINLALLILVPALAFYWRLSRTVFIRMLLLSIVCCVLAAALEYTGFILWQWALAVFVVAWVMQFVGHKIEGKKPSFFTDLAFLLIGPAWIVSGGGHSADTER